MQSNLRTEIFTHICDLTIASDWADILNLGKIHMEPIREEAKATTTYIHLHKPFIKD